MRCPFVGGSRTTSTGLAPGGSLHQFTHGPQVPVFVPSLDEPSSFGRGGGGVWWPRPTRQRSLETVINLISDGFGQVLRCQGTALTSRRLHDAPIHGSGGGNVASLAHRNQANNVPRESTIENSVWDSGVPPSQGDPHPSGSEGREKFVCVACHAQLTPPSTRLSTKRRTG